MGDYSTDDFLGEKGPRYQDEYDRLNREVKRLQELLFKCYDFVAEKAGDYFSDTRYNESWNGHEYNENLLICSECFKRREDLHEPGCFVSEAEKLLKELVEEFKEK